MKKGGLELATATRCTGHCCRDFVVGGGWSRARLVQESFLAQDLGDERQAYESAFIADMIVPIIGQSPDHPERWYTESRHRFTCRHFDRQRSICTVYETRPRMCRSYPHGEACAYAGCTWKEAQAVSRLIENQLAVGRRTWVLSAEGNGNWSLPAQECSYRLVPLGNPKLTVDAPKPDAAT